MSFFHVVPKMPSDPILALPIDFKADPRPQKINLGVGSYKTGEGLPFVLSSVKKGEKILLEQCLDKEYLPIEGDPRFLQCARQLLFGTDSSLLHTPTSFSAQSVGGASALRIGGEFLSKLLTKKIFISHPSWSNHTQIFERAGLEVDYYPYLNFETHLLDYSKMKEAIRAMPPRSAILLHGCCHNPTGIDPSIEQWQELSYLIKEQQLIPFFDIAYQGFGKSIEDDAAPIRLFVQDGHEMFVAYSFSKNFGLYGERVGFLTLTFSEADLLPNISSQIRSLIRGNYSNPPLHGARIISTILSSPELALEWETELNAMRERISKMRHALIQALSSKEESKYFSSLRYQTGLFSFLGLSAEQVDLLRKEKALYMPSNGRINVAGLNEANLISVAQALLSLDFFRN